MKDDQNNPSGLSRRAFFKGSAAAIGSVAAASIVPGAQAAAKDASPCARPSWEKRSKPIPLSEIKQTVDADIVIIGAGLSGMCAALAAKEAGANPIVIDKNKGFAARGLHITGFGTRVQKEMNIPPQDYRQVIRELVRWAQGRVNEDLVWMFGRKCGDSVDWMTDMVEKKGLKVGLWDDYYKGPDYTEYPVTHIVYDPKTKKTGNIILMKALEDTAKERGIQFAYQTPAVQLVRDGNGPVTGVIAGKRGDYTLYKAARGVIIATGDYASNKEMAKYYAPITAMADAQIYFPNKCNTGDGHLMAMAAGGAMQAVEPHAAVVHLEAGAMSYGFLHVNALGKRFKNEDVNTQSKSCSKLYQPDGGIAWTVYDADGLNQVQEQLEKNQAGGLFYGQMERLIGEKWSMEAERRLLESHIKTGKVVVADSIDELAKKMKVPSTQLKATIDRYNELARRGNDEDFGKRPAILRPIVKAPFYAGKLLATVLTACGGLRTDSSLRVLDADDKPVDRLYVVGAAQGDFFAADYPTICPGIGHGRCITFGRLAGLVAAGKSIDSVPSIKI